MGAALGAAVLAGPVAAAEATTPTTSQMVVNARIADAALARVDALTERADGFPLRRATRPDPAQRAAVTPAEMRRNLGIARLAVWRARNIERRLTGLPPLQGGPGPVPAVELTVAQVRSNQRVAQEAIRRARALDPRLPAAGTLDADEISGGIVTTGRGRVALRTDTAGRPAGTRVVVLYPPNIDPPARPYGAMVSRFTFLGRGLWVDDVFFGRAVSIIPTDEE